MHANVCLIVYFGHICGEIYHLQSPATSIHFCDPETRRQGRFWAQIQSQTGPGCNWGQHSRTACDPRECSGPRLYVCDDGNVSLFSSVLAAFLTLPYAKYLGGDLMCIQILAVGVRTSYRFPKQFWRCGCRHAQYMGEETEAQRGGIGQPRKGA